MHCHRDLGIKLAALDEETFEAKNAAAVLAVVVCYRQSTTRASPHNSFLCAGAIGFLINSGGTPIIPDFFSKPSSKVSSA